MVELQKLAKKRGYKGVQLAAQIQAISFYQRLGYESVGESFMDAGIEHRLMRLHFSDNLEKVLVGCRNQESS